ncbi:MAG: DinB family protein [Deinococcota bacterium]
MPMNIHELLIPELEHEASLTETFLKGLPDDKFDWKPHDKSMTLGELANHLVEVFSWVPATMDQDVLDMANYQSPKLASSEALIKQLHANLPAAIESVKKDNAVYHEMWKMVNGDTVFMELPRYTTLRSMVMNQLPHHRAQLGVYLRLLDIPVPATYGPSADAS